MPPVKSDYHFIIARTSNNNFTRIFKTALKAIPIDAPATQMEGCVHTIKKAYRKRAADEFIRVLSQSNAVMERAYNWLNQ